MSRAARARRIAAAAAYGGGGLTALGAGFYGLLVGEARHARRTIGDVDTTGIDCDGIYGSGDGPPLEFVVLGDSLARGIGVREARETVGVMVATGLSAVADRPVRLTNVAFSGARSSDLGAEAARALEAAPAPDLALIFIGGNDVTHAVNPETAVRYLDHCVRTLLDAGAEVIVGTCPDLGTVMPIAQPLRALVRRWSRLLAAAQTVTVVEAGGRTVALAGVLAVEFARNPRDMFSQDRFHPSPQGYAEAAALVLPSCCAALDLWPDAKTLPDLRRGEGVLPVYLAAAEAAAEPGTEVAATRVAGRDRGPRGRWATMMRRRGGAESGGEPAAGAAGVPGTGHG